MKLKLRKLTDLSTQILGERGNSRVGLIGQYFSENEYANFLFYIVSKRFNNLLPQQNPYNYSQKKLQISNLKSYSIRVGLGTEKLHKF